nr:RNA-dependent RNA polymerase [Partitiviridae sp.]
MGKDQTDVIMDGNVKDVLVAQGYTIEESPRSVYKVEKLFEALSHYAPKFKPFVVRSNYLDAGVALAYKCFARKADEQQLHTLCMTPETIVRVTSNPSGSPGLTNYGCSKAESQTRALERGLQTLAGVKVPEPCLAFKRTQFSDKTRLVWGYPYSMTVIEGLVAYPLLQKFKSGNTPMAFAMTSGSLGTKLRVASYHKEWAYSIDMSQFDASLSPMLIGIAFDILRTWFNPNEVEETSGKTVGEIFDIIENYFIHTPIVMPDGKLYLGKSHGVPSGSYFTQMVDSIVNVIIGGTISAKFSLNVSHKEIFVLGDDLLMWSNRKVDLNTISKFANLELGIKMHGAEKSKVFHYDETLHYLGRDWENGLPTLDVDEVVKRMVYPERFRQYSKDREERKRQVKMLLLAYASTYRSAWRIAYQAVDPSNRNIHNGGLNVDVNVYDSGPSHQVDPDHLSGLLRFKLKYHLGAGEGSDYPVTAIQYWL